MNQCHREVSTLKPSQNLSKGAIMILSSFYISLITLNHLNDCILRIAAISNGVNVDPSESVSLSQAKRQSSIDQKNGSENQIIRVNLDNNNRNRCHFNKKNPWHLICVNLKNLSEIPLYNRTVFEL